MELKDVLTPVVFCFAIIVAALWIGDMAIHMAWDPIAAQLAGAL